MDILTLPDIHYEICKYLDIADLDNLAQTCRTLHSLAQTDCITTLYNDKVPATIVVENDNAMEFFCPECNNFCINDSSNSLREEVYGQGYSDTEYGHPAVWCCNYSFPLINTMEEITQDNANDLFPQYHINRLFQKENLNGELDELKFYVAKLAKIHRICCPLTRNNQLGKDAVYNIKCIRNPCINLTSEAEFIEYLKTDAIKDYNPDSEIYMSDKEMLDISDEEISQMNNNRALYINSFSAWRLSLPVHSYHPFDVKTTLELKTNHDGTFITFLGNDDDGKLCEYYISGD